MVDLALAQVTAFGWAAASLGLGDWIGNLVGILPRGRRTAWGSGVLATFLGLFTSYLADLPTGPVVVVAFAVVLIAAFGAKAIVGRMTAPVSTDPTT